MYPPFHPLLYNSFINCTLTMEMIYWFWSFEKGKVQGKVNEGRHAIQFSFNDSMQKTCMMFYLCSRSCGAQWRAKDEQNIIPENIYLYTTVHSRKPVKTQSHFEYAELIWLKVHHGHEKEAFQIYWDLFKNTDWVYCGLKT